MNEATLEWFASLAEVPGVQWQTPEAITVDPRLTEARPVIDPRRAEVLKELGESNPSESVVWIDRTGQLIVDDYFANRSPAEQTLAACREGGEADRAFWTCLEALALPGTRHDYHQGLLELADAQGLSGDWIEAVLRADIQLVLGDPRRAVAPPWAPNANDWLAGASQPILRLIGLYRREGFLLDAANVEALLERLPEAARPQYDYGPRAAEIAAGLKALAK